MTERPTRPPYFARSRPLYVNLPVRDVARTRVFFAALGFRFDPTFSNDDALAMIIGDDARVMLLRESFFDTFTSLQRCDTATQTEVLLAIERSSRAEVDALVNQAIGLGGREAKTGTEQGPMYMRSFYDLDGHHWEVFASDFDIDFVGMTVKMPTARDLVFARTVKAARPWVFAAWTQSEHLLKWYADGAMRACEIDLRAGGQYRFVTELADAEMVQVGAYVRVVKDSCVIFTERWPPSDQELVVHATFEDTAALDETLMTVRFCFASVDQADQALVNAMPEHFARTTESFVRYLAGP